ncbi:hypothetical protein [Sphingomonas aerolata]|uniref:hypothetical protein n=1 Tax=Sphingomonas aerolata TaxID=185951 RepID=UPI00334EC513
MIDIPRRLSVTDADYDPRVGEGLIVLLHGVDQWGRAEGYDIDAGTVTRAKHDASGRLVLEGDEVAMETVAGRVEVTLRA